MGGGVIPGTDPQPGEVRVEPGDVVIRHAKPGARGRGLLQRPDSATIVSGCLVQLGAEHLGDGDAPALVDAAERGQRRVAVQRRLINAAQVSQDDRRLEPGRGGGPRVGRVEVAGEQRQGAVAVAAEPEGLRLGIHDEGVLRQRPAQRPQGRLVLDHRRARHPGRLGAQHPARPSRPGPAPPRAALPLGARHRHGTPRRGPARPPAAHHRVAPAARPERGQRPRARRRPARRPRSARHRRPGRPGP
jgi:hypothetical protein